MKKVCILGSGAFGTAIATVLAHNGHDVMLWCKEQHVATEINETHTNTSFLPGITLSQKITATSDLSIAVTAADSIFIGVPVQFIRSVLQQAKSSIKQGTTVILLSKGIEQTTLAIPTQIVSALLGAHVKTAVLAGPSFAQEVAKQSLTGLVIASSEDDIIKEIMQLMQNDFVKLEKSYDLVGVQLCGAVKNVIALGGAIVEGAGYTSNTKALLLVKCLTELRQLIIHCGGQAITLEGLAGIGDMVLTTYCPESRNVKVGKLIGAGKPLQEVLASVSFVPESINTAVALEQMIMQKGMNMPILSSVNQVVHKKITLLQFLEHVSK